MLRDGSRDIRVARFAIRYTSSRRPSGIGLHVAAVAISQQSRSDFDGARKNHLISDGCVGQVAINACGAKRGSGRVCWLDYSPVAG